MDKNQFLMKQGLKVVARMEVRDRRQATLFHLRFAWDTLLQTSGAEDKSLWLLVLKSIVNSVKQYHEQYYKLY
jgi:hypothetical protein